MCSITVHGLLPDIILLTLYATAAAAAACHRQTSVVAAAAAAACHRHEVPYRRPLVGLRLPRPPRPQNHGRRQEHAGSGGPAAYYHLGTRLNAVKNVLSLQPMFPPIYDIEWMLKRFRCFRFFFKQGYHITSIC